MVKRKARSRRKVNISNERFTILGKDHTWNSLLVSGAGNKSEIYFELLSAELSALRTIDVQHVEFLKVIIRTCLHLCEDSQFSGCPYAIGIVRTDSSATLTSGESTNQEIGAILDAAIDKEFQYETLAAGVINADFLIGDITTPEYFAIKGKIIVNDITSFVRRWWKDYSALGTERHDKLAIYVISLPGGNTGSTMHLDCMVNKFIQYNPLTTVAKMR